MNNTSVYEQILTVDIGGSYIKATVLNPDGVPLHPFKKIMTPRPASPRKVLAAIEHLAAGFENYDKISIGFPGLIRKGIVCTAPNLNSDLWKDINLCALISEAFGKPVRIINDADMQGLGVSDEKGLEMIITLGTGFGSALLLNGHLLPHFELAHHPVSKNKTYDEYVGSAALEKEGEKKWNKRMKKVLKILKTVFNYDRLYIGGGNSSRLNFKLDKNIVVITNKDGIKGGAKLWQLDETLFMKSCNTISNTLKPLYADKEYENSNNRTKSY